MSLREKVNIIEEGTRGMSATTLSKKYGVSTSTICGIKKNEKLIIDTVTHTLKISKKCTLKKSAFLLLEEKLYNWFLKEREKNSRITGNMLKLKAFSLSKQLNTDTFTASDGWLQRFKYRRGLRFLKIAGEKLSANLVAVDPFKEDLKHMIQDHDLKRQQIYNINETGLYWRLLPDKIDKTAPGLKISKQRLTFMGCVNASGLHKLKPLLYKSTKKAWMTGELFKEWFFQHFVPEVRCFLRAQELPQKAILFVDNATFHPPATELRTKIGMIFVKFLPPDVTSSQILINKIKM
nr:jerky protein homolog-like [Onthophagus taurus]